MIKDAKEADFPHGEEGNNHSSEIGKAIVTSTTSKASSSTTTPWLRLKDPRIVRVSRVFGGKDRHSKVTTVRGLRDRRVRLSVPTAIQLYDLQDRLGLNQPSKVVDWLLDAAKNEIDELPPLPSIPGPNFSLLMPRGAITGITPSGHDHQGVAKSNSDHGKSMEWDPLGNSSRLGWSNFWSSTTSITTNDTKSKEVGKEDSRGGTKNHNGHEGLGKEEECEEQEEEGSGGVIVENNLLSRNNSMINNHHPFFPGILNNIANNLPNGYRWEAPNYPVIMSHFGGIGHGLSDHNNNLQSLNDAVPQPSTLSLSTGSQYLLSPHGSNHPGAITSSNETTKQTYFPNLLELHDPRQENHFQMPQNLLPNPMRSLFHFGMNDSPRSESGNNTSRQNKDVE